MCIHAVETITRLWQVSTDEDKQGMARHLFEYITYDLDKQEIVDFRLKPWADQFLVLRTVLYAEEKKNDHQIDDRRIAPTRFGLIRQPLEEIIQWLLVFGELRDKPNQHNRNTEIRRRHGSGEPLSHLAREFGISPQRVHQIVNFKSK